MVFLIPIGMANDSQNLCEGESIHTLLMPINHHDKNMGQFKYHYRHEVINYESDAPTIVFIPGGPGQGSVKTFDPEMLPFSTLLKEFNFVTFDPREVGCNEYGTNVLGDKVITTEQYTFDIMTILNHLNIKNYVIWGVSYGAVVATYIGEKSDFLQIQPRGIILEGTMSHREHSSKLGLNFREIYEAYCKVNPHFKENLGKPPFSEWFNRSEWRDILYSLLSVGYEQSNYVFGMVNAIERVSPDELNDLKGFLDAINADVKKEQEDVQNESHRFSNLILVRELFEPSLEIPFLDEKSDLVFKDCKEGDDDAYEALLEQINLFKVTTDFHGYDSKEHQIREGINVFYFHGALDPIIPLEDSWRHFSSQKSLSKFYFPLQMGGHNPLMHELLGCHDKIIHRIFSTKEISNIDLFDDIVDQSFGRCL